MLTDIFSQLFFLMKTMILNFYQLTKYATDERLRKEYSIFHKNSSEQREVVWSPDVRENHLKMRG